MTKTTGKSQPRVSGKSQPRVTGTSQPRVSENITAAIEKVGQIKGNIRLENQ